MILSSNKKCKNALYFTLSPCHLIRIHSVFLVFCLTFFIYLHCLFHFIYSVFISVLFIQMTLLFFSALKNNESGSLESQNVTFDLGTSASASAIVESGKWSVKTKTQNENLRSFISYNISHFFSIFHTYFQTKIYNFKKVTAVVN